MRFQNSKDECKFNKFLASLIPVIEDRSKPMIRIRLWLNYFLETLLFMAIGVKKYTNVVIPVGYLQLACLIIRLCLSLAALRFGRLNIQLLNKLFTILSVFCLFDPQFHLLFIVTFVIQIPVSWMFAFSGEQRRGNFDERLNLWIPFYKQLCAVGCVFLCFGFNNNVCYLLMLLSVLHLMLSCADQLYNFETKRVLIGTSILNVVVSGSLMLLIEFPDLDPPSLIVVSASVYIVIGIWLLNFRQYDNFKILEQNPNNFAEWQYSQYFNKMLFLIENRKTKENDQLLRGFYNFHLTRCTTPECPITYSHEIDKIERFQNEQHATESYEDDFDKKIEFIHKYLCNQMQIASIKYPSLQEFYIFYISPSIDALRYCNKQQFTEYREWLRIEKYLRDKHVEFNAEKSKSVREEIKEKLQSYLDMSNSLWRLLYDDNLDLKRLQNFGCSILELREQIREYETNPYLDNKSMRLLNDFKKLILDENIAQVKQIEQQKKQIVFDEIHTKEAPIMVLSAEPETIQKIESVNAACCQLLGYSKTELMEKNLSHILPEFILVAHQELLTQRSREILYTQEKNLSTLVYAVTSSGYLVESRLSIMQLNSITGRKWRCTFQPTYSKNCLIILDNNNIVQGITSNGLPLRLNLNTIGREVRMDLIEQLEKNIKQSIPVENRIDNLYEEETDEYPMLPTSTITIKIKDVVKLGNILIKILELESQAITDSIHEKHDILQHDKEFFVYNFPNLISNSDYKREVDIRVPQETHYEFVNFGEGINEMRYLNGQIQYKEDKSESSFEKEKTENSMVQIIDFNMKKETYLEALELSRKNLPRPIFELNILVTTIVIVLTGIFIANFVIFSLTTQTHITSVYVLSQLHIWFYEFYQMAATAVAIGYINNGIWSTPLPVVFANMTRHLNIIGETSKTLTQNESTLNQLIASYKIDSSTSLYDIIAQFKLDINTLLNNQSMLYDFSANSPISDMQNLTVNYIIPGFQSVSDQLTLAYTSAVQSSIKQYIIFLLCFIGVCLPVLIRIYFINRRLNKQKQKLLSIFLEVDESTAKKLIERNNVFKMMVKYDRDLANDDLNNNQPDDDSEQDEKCAGKRIKDIQYIHYFYPFMVFFLLLCGMYSLNIYMEISYINILNADYNQLVVYDRAHFSGMETWLYTNYLAVYSGQPIQNQTDYTDFLIGCVSNIYNKQMKLRELYLSNLNAQLFSTSFSDFFVDFWVTNGCSYLTYQGCPTDYNTIFKQGADQVWSLAVRKLDLLVSNLISATANGFPANYFLTFGVDQTVGIIRNLNTFYNEDVLMVFNHRFVTEIICNTPFNSDQIQRILSIKTILLGTFLAFILTSLFVYLGVLVRLMRRQTERIERIVGFIPFRELVTITEFKKYIRNKYETEIY